MAPTPGQPSKVCPGLFISGIVGLDAVEGLKITHIVVMLSKSISMDLHDAVFAPMMPSYVPSQLNF